MGRELGARREEAECYIDGRAAYDRITQLPAFSVGIKRILAGAASYRIALMCAEHDPLTCHRTILIGRELKQHDILIQHIGRTGMLEDHEQAEQRLITEEFGRLDQYDMFAGQPDAAQVLEAAYSRRARDIAYTQKD